MICRIILSAIILTGTTGCQLNGHFIDAGQTSEACPVVGVKVKRGIKVVYQIKTDHKKGTIGAGLHYVKKLIDAYQDINISASDRDVHAVIHGDAGYRMLKDKPYMKETNSNTGNPNKKLIDELLSRGVKLELCASTMESHGWTPEDILEGVTIVIGAYPRIIDLQMRGYAYIRF